MFLLIYLFIYLKHIYIYMYAYTDTPKFSYHIAWYDVILCACACPPDSFRGFGETLDLRNMLAVYNEHARHICIHISVYMPPCNTIRVVGCQIYKYRVS